MTHRILLFINNILSKLPRLEEIRCKSSLNHTHNSIHKSELESKYIIEQSLYKFIGGQILFRNYICLFEITIFQSAQCNEFVA